MSNFIKYVFDINLVLLIRIIISVTCGIIIGFERENRHKDAGTRTHGIVALGSCLSMILSAYGFPNDNNIDPTRIAAQVVSGIGFLGAGIIFVRKDRNISGLTTAAGIWTTAIISMVIGSGMVLIGILSTFLIISLQWLLSKLKVKSQLFGEQVFYITTFNSDFKLDELMKLLENLEAEVLYLERDKTGKIETDMELVISLPENMSKWQITNELVELEGIKSVET